MVLVRPMVGGLGVEMRLSDASGRRAKWKGERREDWIGYRYGNPVRRGVVDRATDWPWSSALWYAGKRGNEVSGVIIDPVA